MFRPLSFYNNYIASLPQQFQLPGNGSFVGKYFDSIDTRSKAIQLQGMFILAVRFVTVYYLADYIVDLYLLHFHIAFIQDRGCTSRWIRIYGHFVIADIQLVDANDMC